MVELNITVSELESKLLGLRFMELKRFLILMFDLIQIYFTPF